MTDAGAVSATATAVATGKPAVVSLQWEVSLQASSSSQLEVVNDDGTVLLSCAVETAALRAASGDGSTMRARSLLDAVLQLSFQASCLSLKHMLNNISGITINTECYNLGNHF